MYDNEDMQALRACIKEAQALLDEGKGNWLVHFIGDDFRRGISSPLSPDEFRRGGYTSVYYIVSDMADWMTA